MVQLVENRKEIELCFSGCLSLSQFEPGIYKLFLRAIPYITQYHTNYEMSTLLK